jgi:RHS repeat-associated protein
MSLQTALTGASTVVSAVSYLPFGPISSYTLGNGQTVSRSYDANYAPTDVVSPALNLHFARDATGNISALGNTFGANPAIETYAYDPLHRLTAVVNGGTASESYTYNKTGDRLSKTASGLDTGTYGYTNGTHQLASVGNALRANDANGNTTGRVSGGETFGFGYNDRNRLTVAQRNGQTVGTYIYNAFGQRISKVATLPRADTKRYVYDEVGHLIGEYGTTYRDYVWLGDIPVAVVDADGGVSPPQSTATPLQKGVTVQISGASASTTQFSLQVPAGALGLSMRTLGGTGDVALYVKFGEPASVTNYDFVSEHLGTNSEAVVVTRPGAGTYYLAVVGGTGAYANVTVLGTYSAPAGSTPGQTGINYITADHLGTPRAVSDQSGNVIWEWAYLSNPFGEKQPTSTIGYVLNLRYPGQYFDAESGTNYNINRTYEPTTGRYLQSDPIGFDGGISTYGYVNLNPLNGIDPLGLADLYIWKGYNGDWGHSSLKLNDGTYISWWPQDINHEYTSPLGSLAPALFEADARVNQTYDLDRTLERHKESQIIHLDNLDEGAIRDWWEKFKRSHKYNSTGQNCSTTVVDALEAGGSGRHLIMYPKPMVWAPEDVQRYGEALRSAGAGQFFYMPGTPAVH